MYFTMRSRANLRTLKAEWIPGALGDMVVGTARATETPLELAGLIG
jgi:hypothetical protein